VFFFLGQGYMLFLGYDLLPVSAMLEILGLIVVSSFTFSSFFFVLTFLFTTSRSFGSLGTIVGTLVGFFGGIYVPVGVLASGVVTLMNFVPVAHAVTLFRQAYTSVTLTLVFDGAPVDVVRDFSLFFGLDIQYGSYVMPSFLIFFVLIGYGLLFFSLSTFLLTKQKRA
jgi:multidrug/hemolysin transport system permease protein